MEPLSKTRCEPSVRAGMRPFGLIFKNHLCSIVVSRTASVISEDNRTPPSECCFQYRLAQSYRRVQAPPR